MKKFLSIFTFLMLAASPVLAQDDDTVTDDPAMETDVYDNDDYDHVDVDAIDSDYDRPASDSGRVENKVIVEDQPAAEPAAPAATVEAPAPTVHAPSFRITPVGGVASFGVDKATTDNFDEGFAAGLLLGFGRAWSFETGLLSLQTDVIQGGAGVDIDTLGVPLFVKYNFTGNPNAGLFVKAGAMPFWDPGELDDFEDVDLLGVAGLGGAIPVTRNASILLDASYNRNLTDQRVSNDYQGYTVLAGIQIGI
jgi:hypothetical protein